MSIKPREQQRNRAAEMMAKYREGINKGLRPAHVMAMLQDEYGIEVNRQKMHYYKKLLKNNIIKEYIEETKMNKPAESTDFNNTKELLTMLLKEADREIEQYTNFDWVGLRETDKANYDEHLEWYDAYSKRKTWILECLEEISK